MDLTVERRRLADELSLLAKVTPRRTPVPVFTCALATADADTRTFTLAATDARVGLSTVLRDVDVKEAGAFLLPLTKAADLVSTLGEAPVRLRTVGDSVQLSSGGYTSTLLTFGVGDFPALPERETNGLPRAIATDLLRALIKRTEYAVSDHDDARAGGAAITGAQFAIEHGRVSMVATNGHRMAVAESTVDGLPDTECLLSRRLLTAAMGVLDGTGGSAEVEVDDRHAFIGAGDRLVFGQLVEGRYPNWRRMLRTHPIRVAVSCDALTNALKRARLLSIDNRAVLKFESDTLCVSANEVGIGSGDDVLALPYAHEPVTFGVNAGYLLDFLGAIEVETVTIAFRDADDAVMLHATEGPIDSTYLVMPVRL